MEQTSTDLPSPLSSVDWRVAAIVSAAVGLTAVTAVRSLIQRQRELQKQQAKHGGHQSLSQSSNQQSAQNGLNRSSANASADNSASSNNAAAAPAASPTSNRRFVHRGIRCKICECEPIIGDRYKCTTCPMFDVCEICEQTLDHVHDRTHLFLKIRIPIPLRAIPSHPLLPVFYPGKDANSASTLSNSDIRSLQTLTHFTREEIENLHTQYKTLSVGGKIDMDTFERCLGPLGQVPNLLTKRLFSMFDQDNDGQIDFQELCCGLSVLLKGDSEEKIRYAFETYDLDSDGYITQEELSSVVKAYFYLSQMAVRDAMKQIDQEALDRWNDTAAEPVSKAFAQVAVPGISAQQQANLSAPPAHSSSSSSSSSSLSSSSSNPLSMSQILPVSEQASTALLRLDQSIELAPDKAQLLEGAYTHAVEVLVRRAMETADKDKDGRINYAEFREWALQDRTILAWLDSVGSVF